MSPNPEKHTMQTLLSEEDQAKLNFYSKDVEQDKELKKKLLLEVVESFCDESSDYEDFRSIRAALDGGGVLNAEVISGGLTNYSYKVFLQGELSHALYAKIYFSSALWNPDKNVHYDVARGINEYKIMKRFKELMNEKFMNEEAPVAKPYICVAVEDVMVLVTQWANADEQWANQFIDGEVDSRIILKLAQALAALNLAPFDDGIDITFNDNIFPCIKSMSSVIKSNFGQKMETSDSTMDPCIAHMKTMGQEKFDMIVDESVENLREQQCLNHSDCHCFNLLVERKPNVDDLLSFGINGDLVICDWEMALAGPCGADSGTFQSWPIACALMHAANGRKEIAYSLVECCINFWDSYAKALVEDGKKDDAFINSAFRTSLGWAGKHLFFWFYLVGAFNENLPTENLAVDMIAKGKGAIGIVGLSFLEHAFGGKGHDLSLDELRIRFREIILREIRLLVEASANHQVHAQSSSLLRQSGRRVSDSMLLADVDSFEVRKLFGDQSNK